VRPNKIGAWSFTWRFMRVSWYRQELELEASEFQDIEELNESLYIALSEIHLQTF
jgi:hypothetical protein